MGIIEQQRLPIGTIIIDAKWQKTFGGFEVDKEKWPDMRGFINACHKKGIHVILWIKAWDPQGLDDDECIIRKGESVSPDPTSDKYRKRLRKGLHYMLSPQSGCLNADGLKIDGTNCMPVGQDIITRGNVYGYELQYEYLRFVYENAKQAKSDALISLYTANPYFRDVCDMIRLGDLYSL